MRRLLPCNVKMCIRRLNIGLFNELFELELFIFTANCLNEKIKINCSADDSIMYGQFISRPNDNDFSLYVCYSNNFHLVLDNPNFTLDNVTKWADQLCYQNNQRTEIRMHTQALAIWIWLK